MNKYHLYDWVFHFNPYTNQWAAIPKNSYNDYWNEHESECIIRSTSFNTILEILYKTEGEDIEKKLNIE